MYLNVNEVAWIFGVSTCTIWRWSREGLFPAPVKLGPGTTRWASTALEELGFDPEAKARFAKVKLDAQVEARVAAQVETSLAALRATTAVLRELAAAREAAVAALAAEAAAAHADQPAA